MELLHTYQRQLTASGQSEVLIARKAAGPGWAVGFEEFGRTRAIDEVTARIDLYVHDLLITNAINCAYARPHPHGLGELLARHIWVWAHELTADHDFLPTSGATQALVEQAFDYDCLVARVVSGRVCLPLPLPASVTGCAS
ncbi:hypothetical protein [Nocardia sp. NPDC047038]|uniref:hypothetical protein n=1 Tax=Nocardia sp. NPDC047038 TaxID=3154338 RepID=UPI0033F588BC